MGLTLEELVDLAVKVTGMTRHHWDWLVKVQKDDAAMNGIMKAEWGQRPRDSEEAIREYYRSSHIWFVNTFSHGHLALLNISSAAAPALEGWHEVFLNEFKGGVALDYGGGFFNDSWPLVNKGIHIVQGEVKGPVTVYLKKFLEIHSEKKVTASILEVDAAEPLTELYDGACCFETLEHLLDPKTFAKHLTDHLKVGAPFAFSASFGDPEHAPYHVASNARLGVPGAWDEYMISLKMELIWKAPGGHKQVWRKR